MLLLRAIIRPEKVKEVLDALLQEGYSVTKMEVYGRRKAKGIQIGDVFYDEIPKEMIFMVIEDGVKEIVVDIIMEHALRNRREWKFSDGRLYQPGR